MILTDYCQWQHDELRHLLASTEAEGHATHHAYDEWGYQVSATYPDGSTTTCDALGRPTSQRVSTGGGGQQQHRRYQWQGADQLLEVEDSQQGTTAFRYDAWGHLAGASFGDGSQELRQPDAVGNLFRSQERTDRRYDKGGQLQQAGGTRYKYDEEGNLIRKTLADGRQWHYAWDGAGQLVKVTRPDGYAVTFSYDALGRRVSKRFRGRVTKWVWDGDKPLHEWSELEVGPGAGSVQDLATWLFEENSFAPAAKLTASGAQSVVCDHLGTPLSMYDGQGKATWEMALDSYGGVRQGRGKAQDCPFRYQGQYEDTETGLYYNRFRYYDPEAGQYISQDPIGVFGGHHLYAYVNNPLSRIDIFGLTGCKAGTANIQWSPPQPGAPGRFGHFSIEVSPAKGMGPSTHTHQVIEAEDLSTTTISRLNSGTRSGVTKSAKIGITNAEDAIKFQTESIGQELGPYGIKNNCVDHVCEVLRQGGEVIPKSVTGQLGYLRELGIF